MKPRAALHQSAPQRKIARQAETGDDLAVGADLYMLAQPRADQHVADQDQTFPQGSADVVGQFVRGCAGAALATVDNDEVWQDAGGERGLGDSHEFHRMAHAELEARWFASGQFAQLLDEAQQSFRS